VGVLCCETATESAQPAPGGGVSALNAAVRPRSDSEAELLGRPWRASVLPQPPGRGGRDRRLTGRPTRDGSADRSAQGMRSCASQLRCLARSVGGGARGAGAVDRQAILAQGRELDDEVERRADLLS